MTLKNVLSVLTLTLVLLAVAPLRTRAATGVESDPAYLPIDQAIDLKVLRPEVDVNLPRFLLMDAVSEFKGGTNDPFAAAGINLADLVKDVKLIRVVVIEANKTNRAALASGVTSLRHILEKKWTPVAVVSEENVGVYALGDATGEAMAGLALLVHDDGDAVIANIVGRVSLGKIVKIASHFDQLPKDFLNKLMTASGQAEGKSEGKSKAKSNKAEPESQPGSSASSAPASTPAKTAP